MNWKVKAAVQHAFSVVPGGDTLNFLAQRHVIRTLPQREGPFQEDLRHAAAHLEAIREHWTGALREATFYEFGAGQMLTVSLAFYAAGVDRQILLDVRPLARLALVAHTVRRFQDVPLSPPWLRRPPVPTDNDLRRSLRDSYGIEYRAPADARCVDRPAGSVDVVTSTDTMEHIPPDVLLEILRECHRLLKPGGLLSVRIDYRDHYARVDPDVGVYHFLAYDDRTWARYNPPLHFQNRLRHSDYLGLLTAAGFSIVAGATETAPHAERARLGRLVLADRFAAYDPEDLAITQGHLVAVKAA